MGVAFLPVDDAADPSLTVDHLPDFVLVPTGDVELGERLREIDPVWASALGQVMLREGQRTPIEICRLPGRTGYTLVSGGHRLVGAQEAGIPHMRAEIVGADRTERRLREVSENLWRRDLQPIDRAAFIAELVSLRRARVGLAEADSRSAKVKPGLKKAVEAEATGIMDTMSMIYGFTEEVGDELGLSGRTIRRDLMLYRGIAPSQIARLREVRHSALANATQLRALAKLDPVAQNKVVDLLVWPGASLNYGQPATIADAIKHPLGPNPAKAKPTPERQRFNTVLDAIKRMSTRERSDLFQSPQFHAVIPVAARQLLEPLLGTTPNEQGEHSSSDQGSNEGGLARHGRSTGTGGAHSLGSGRNGRGKGQSARANDLALDGGSHPSDLPDGLEGLDTDQQRGVA